MGRLHVCRKDLGEVLVGLSCLFLTVSKSAFFLVLRLVISLFFPLQNPFTDNSELQKGTARMLSLNTWDIAVALSNDDWTIFDSIHEVCLNTDDLVTCHSKMCSYSHLWTFVVVLS